jgi:hypothetical protein
MRVVPTIDDRLVQAVVDRRRVEITYSAHPDSSGLRLIEPHVIYTARSGAVTLDAVQVAGDSSSGLSGGTGWRGFDLAQVQVVRLLETRFAVDERLDLDDRDRYVNVLLAVDD